MLLLVAAGFAFGEDVYRTARDLASLRAERKLLAAEVERLQTELAVERASRIEIERQASELNSQVAELNGQVRFLLGRRVSGTSGE